MHVKALKKITLTLLALACNGPHAANAIAAGARLAASCAACHGTQGATVGTSLRPLAGQPREALLQALKAYKSGERAGTIMPQLAKGYSDEQLQELSAYFAAQSAAAKPGKD
jgi:sulfide dehydrogenase cytochrome subunit